MTGVLFATMDEARPLLDRCSAEQIVATPLPVYRLRQVQRDACVSPSMEGAASSAPLSNESGDGEPRSCLVIISGMGIDAARRACRELIETYAVRSVINAGVCGALAEGIDRGNVYAIDTVASEFADCPNGRARLLPSRVTGKLEHKTLVTVTEPVFDSARRAALATVGDLVDMEGFGVAETCLTLGISCCLIKGVTDFCDGKGRDDIREHLLAVSGNVAEQVLGLLDRRASASGALVPKLLRFTRIEHTLFSLPLLFAGAWLGAGGQCPPLRVLALIAVVGTGARTFGMAVNRIADRRLDAKNPRTAQRELPAGRMPLWQAYVVAAIGLAAYLCGCALLGPIVLRLALVPIVPLALYSFLKRFTSLCHYGIGVCLALAPLGAYVAVRGDLMVSPGIVLLTLFTFGWMSGFDIIYALLDVDFDRAHGVRSLPAAIGPVRAQWVAALTHLISAAVLIRLWYDAGGWMSGLALLVALGALAAAYWQKLPIAFRFFPISVIAGIAGALVVLMERLP